MDYTEKLSNKLIGYDLYEMFDIVAPIAIYHYADLNYKDEAKAALKKVGVAQKALDDDNVADFVFNEYNNIFEAIVQHNIRGYKPSRDYYGAKCFANNRSETILAGDSINQYPWYLQAQLLEDRCKDINEGL